MEQILHHLTNLELPATVGQVARGCLTIIALEAPVGAIYAAKKMSAFAAMSYKSQLPSPAQP
jgi:hypothetical protein